MDGIRTASRMMTQITVVWSTVLLDYADYKKVTWNARNIRTISHAFFNERLQIRSLTVMGFGVDQHIHVGQCFVVVLQRQYTEARTKLAH